MVSVMATVGLLPQEINTKIPNNLMLVWSDIETPLELKFKDSNLKEKRCLTAKQGIGEGLSQEKLKNAEVSLRFRQGGETCAPVGRGQTHQLKKLFQEWKILPWQRASVPLIYVGDELAQVVGYCHSESFAAKEGEPGWLIE